MADSPSPARQPTTLEWFGLVGLVGLAVVAGLGLSTLLNSWLSGLDSKSSEVFYGCWCAFGALSVSLLPYAAMLSTGRLPQVVLSVLPRLTVLLGRAAVLGGWMLLGASARPQSGPVELPHRVGGLAWCVLLAVGALVYLELAVRHLAQQKGTAPTVPPEGAAYAKAMALCSAAAVLVGLLGALTGYSFEGSWASAMLGFAAGNATGLAWAASSKQAMAAWVECQTSDRAHVLLLTAGATCLLLCALRPNGPNREALAPLFETYRQAAVWGGLVSSPLLPALFWFDFAVTTRVAVGRLAPTAAARAWRLHAIALLLPLLVAVLAAPLAWLAGILLAVLFLTPIGWLLGGLAELHRPTAGTGERAGTGPVLYLLPGLLGLFTVLPVAGAAAAWFDWLFGHFAALGG